MKKVLFLILGTISLILAYIGIALPGFPGTPFILLTAYFFVRSSPRMNTWILKQKIFSQLISKFKENPIIPLKLKLLVLAPIWMSAVIADYLYVERFAYIVLLYFAIVVITVLVLMLKKVKF